jgi:phage terminase large subunit-like protein
MKERRPKKVLFDPHNASRLITLTMEAGFEVQRFTQNHLNYNEPMRELERLANAGLLEHGGNKVMSWMVNNVQINRNAAGYVMPDKGANRLKKIDGVPASLMALAEAIKHIPKPATEFETW